MQSAAAVLRRKANLGGPFDPMSLAPVQWLDGSDTSTLFDATSGGSLPADTGNVKRWEDKSGNGRHFTENTNPPTRAAASVNGLDTVRLQTASLLTRTGGTGIGSGSNNFFIFIVLKTADTAYVSITESTLAAFMDATESGSGSGISGGIFDQSYRVNGSAISNTRGDLYTARGSNANVLAITGATLFGGFDDMRLNYAGYEVSDGNFCELLIYKSALTAGDVADVENYLITKWGI